MNDDYYKLYSKGFEKFLTHTDEKQVFIDEFTNHIKAYQTKSILDIGAGNGTVAIPIASMVQKYVAIEHNPKYIKKLQDAGLAVVEGSFPMLIDGSFDLVLLSHAISYTERNHIALISNAWDLVNPGGYLLTVTHRGESDEWSQLLDSIDMNKDEHYSEVYTEIIEALEQRGATEIRRVITTLETDNIEDMVSALSFVAGGGRQELFEQFMSSTQRVREILDKSYRHGKTYSFPFTHIFIATKKA